MKHKLSPDNQDRLLALTSLHRQAEHADYKKSPTNKAIEAFILDLVRNAKKKAVSKVKKSRKWIWKMKGRIQGLEQLIDQADSSYTQEEANRYLLSTKEELSHEQARLFLLKRDCHKKK